MILLAAAGAWAAAVPHEGHVFVVVEENHSYSSVIGSSAMPYLNSLAQKYGLATRYYADSHPSIGNYFMMTAGQTITTNDSFCSTVSNDNLVRHLLSSGQTWKSYAESLPYAGYLGCSSGYYLKRHNPFAYFSDVANSSVQRMNLVPFTQFSKDLANGTLPRFSFIVPNVMDDAHNGSLSQADSWLKTNIAPLLASATFQKNGLLLIVFDESFDSDTAYGGGHVAMVAVGPQVRAGYRSSNLYQHQNLLKTAMEALGLTSFPGSASSAAPMADFFGSASTGCSAAPDSVHICSPAAGATVGSPVVISAAAQGATSITSMIAYVDSVKVAGTSTGLLNGSVSLRSGTHSLVVNAWDSQGTLYQSKQSFSVN